MEEENKDTKVVPIDKFIAREQAKSNVKKTHRQSKDEAIAEIKSRTGATQSSVPIEISTRDIIERDYRESIMKVGFQTSDGVTRAIKVHRPNQKQMLQILRLTAIGLRFGEQANADQMEKMIEVYEKMPKMAAELSIDETMDEEFWTELVTFPALMDLIFGIIRVSQTGGLSGDQVESFR